MATFLTSLRGRPAVSWLVDNPLLVREMRRRMRGRSFTWSLIAYVAALGLVSCFIMYATYPKFGNPLSTREMIQAVGRIGSRLFTGMCFVEAVIALIVTPMITAGLATAEKEKDTFEFLQVTTLSPATFVIGCLLTTGSFLFMVFACTLPILGLTFIFGGVSLGDILAFNGMLFLLSLTISAWGIFNSTSYRRSRTVMGAIALVIVLLLVLGVASLGTFVSRAFGLGGYGAPALSSTYGYIALALTGLMGAFSVAAARRLYEPNNRLFNYRQYIIFFVAAMGATLGLIYWNARPPVGGSAFSSTDIHSLTATYYAFGWSLLAAAILFFSAGRVERGDELWRLRLDRPAFRAGLDAGLVYLLLGLVWLGSSAGLVVALGNPPDPGRTISGSLLPLLSALFMFYAICRLTSTLAQTRNRAAIVALGAVSLIWIMIPLLGYFFGEISSAGGMQPSPLVGAVSEMLTQLSPLVVLIRAADHISSAEILRATIVNLALGLAILLPTFAAPLRRRLVVSYDYMAHVDAGARTPEPASAD